MDLDEGLLAGLRILVAEDDYMLAFDTARLLTKAGATVIGPFAKVAQVHERITDNIDIALLDIRLDGEKVFSAADRIVSLGRPVAFLTGYDQDAIPARFADVPTCQKPCDDDTLIDIVRQLTRGGPPSAS